MCKCYLLYIILGTHLEIKIKKIKFVPVAEGEDDINFTAAKQSYIIVNYTFNILRT